MVNQKIDQLFEFIRNKENDKIRVFLQSHYDEYIEKFNYINMYQETIYDVIVLANNIEALKIIVEFNIENVLLFENDYPYPLNCLFFALEKLNLPIIQYLVNTYIRSVSCITPLNIGIINNKLDLNQDVNELDQWNRTSLFYSNSSRMTKILIKIGCKTDVKDFSNNSLLHLANKNTISTLLKYIKVMPEKNFQNETPVMTHLKRHEYDIVKTFIKYDMFNDDDIYEIVMSTNIECITALLCIMIKKNNVCMQLLMRFYMAVIEAEFESLKIYLNLNIHKLDLMAINPLNLTSNKEIIDLLILHGLDDDISIESKDIEPTRIPDCIYTINNEIEFIYALIYVLKILFVILSKYN